MSPEGAPKQPQGEDNEKYPYRGTAQWGELYKKQLSYYGSPENSHAIEMEYKEELESGEITFNEALKDYAARMTDATHKMKQKMNTLEQQKNELYGQSNKSKEK